MNKKLETMPVDLAGFSGPELTILSNHLRYAADRLQQEMDSVRQTRRKDYLYPRNATRKTKAGPPRLMTSFSHGEAALWAGLIRDCRYFTGLARAVEGVLGDPWDALFISRPLPPLDLSVPLSGDIQHFSRFLNRERHRAQLAVAYLQKETFDEQVKQDLLLALNIEIRFLTCLLEWLEPLVPTSQTVTGSEEDRVPLLFVSLPRVLTSCHSSAWSNTRKPAC